MTQDSACGMFGIHCPFKVPVSVSSLSLSPTELRVVVDTPNSSSWLNPFQVKEARGWFDEDAVAPGGSSVSNVQATNSKLQKDVNLLDNISRTIQRIIWGGYFFIKILAQSQSSGAISPEESNV